MLDRTLLSKTIRQIPDLKNLVSCSSVHADCYRSRIPFITAEQLAHMSLLLKFCMGDYEDLRAISNGTSRLRMYSNLAVLGYCTDRSSTMTNDVVHSYISDLYSSRYGTQINLINVTNRAHYPVIINYIRANNYDIITQATTQVDGKPADFIGIRTVHTPERDGLDYTVEKYTIFTTVWNYDLNLSFVHTALNHMLTNPIPYDNEEYLRPVKSRLAYSWFKKYFEGVDVTPLIIEYFTKEFVDKLDELKRTAILNTLETFSKTKVEVNDNIETAIRRLRQRIKDYEADIATTYEEIRRTTLQKLTESDKANLLENAIKIFQGMLAKGMLTGFNYSVYNNTLESFSWCVRIPITYWEEDEAKYWLNTFKSNTYKHDLFKAMFIDKLVTSWCEQYMTIHLTSNGRPSNSTGQGEYESVLYPPNPHVGRYNCFGNNANEVIRAINNKDVTTAITICMNACMQLNMTDHTVTSHWMSECVPSSTDYDHLAFLEYRGNMYTPTQLYNLYKAEGGFNNGEETQINQQAEEADA